MRITLNLASRPHIDLRPYLQRMRLWILVLAVLSFTLWTVLHNQQSKAAAVVAEEDMAQQNMQKLQKEKQQFQQEMGQPQNAAVLEQSEFLNQLFRRKAFSWTAVMMDLETVLPPGVQVSALEPSIAPGTGTVSIKLRVMGPRDKAVDLVKNLEHTRRFVAPRLLGEAADTGSGPNNGGMAVLQPTNASSQVIFEIMSDYNPLAPNEKYSAPKIPQPVTEPIAAVVPIAAAPAHRTIGRRGAR